MCSNSLISYGGNRVLPVLLSIGAGCQIVKRCAGERMRPLAAVDRMTAAVLHPQQFVLALVEFVVADRGYRQSHHRQRFDSGLIVEHRGQQRAGADQISGGDKDRIFVALAQLLDQRRHVLDTAGRNHDLPGAVGGIDDPDPAGRRPKVAMQIVDREDSQRDRRGLRGSRAGRARRRARNRGSEDLAKRTNPERRSHEMIIERQYNDLTKPRASPSCAQGTP